MLCDDSYETISQSKLNIFSVLFKYQIIFINLIYDVKGIWVLCMSFREMALAFLKHSSNKDGSKSSTMQ